MPGLQVVKGPKMLDLPVCITARSRLWGPHDVDGNFTHDIKFVCGRSFPKAANPNNKNPGDVVCD